MTHWLLYGAYGYTGRLIAQKALERGMRPVLAGRDPEATRREAAASGLEHRAFPLDDPATVRQNLRRMDLVLNTAGPFSATFRPMARACLHAGCHYLDITGEVDVFEAAWRLDADARRAGVVVLPGVGFEVVPSDCLMAELVAGVERPARATIAYAGSGRPSRGTLRTVLEGAGAGSRIRREGRWVPVRPGSVRREVPFSDAIRTCVALPLGDLATAPRTTGIGTVQTLVAMPARLAAAALAPAATVLALGPVRRAARVVADALVRGPSTRARERGHVRIWCEVAGADGQGAVGEIVTPDAYTFTASSAVAAVERVLAGATGRTGSNGGTGGTGPNGATGRTGATTPSLALGRGFAESLPGVRRVR